MGQRLGVGGEGETEFTDDERFVSGRLILKEEKRLKVVIDLGNICATYRNSWRSPLVGSSNRS